MEVPKSDKIQVLALPQGVKRNQLEVDYNPIKHGRRPFPGPGFSSEDIDAIWRDKSATNSRLYDAPKFRLAALSLHPASDNYSAIVRVGLTSYKDMLGTHHSPLAGELTRVKDHGYDEEFPFASRSMGIGVFPITTDGFVPLIKRSAWTAEAANKIDRVGGHPEPDQAVTRVLKGEKESVIDRESLSNEQVLEEIFDSPQAELRDEINVEYQQQGEPLLIGEVSDLSIAGRPALDFVIHLKITKDQVESRYRSGDQAEADETTDLLFLPLEKIKNWSFEESDQEMFAAMAVHCKAGLKLFNKYLNHNDVNQK